MLKDNMKEQKITFFKSLKWKMTVGFLVILILLSAVYLYISVFTAEMYFQEATQKLSHAIAKHIADDTKCFSEGKANDAELKKVFRNAMIVNPSIEIYLLDVEGKILTYDAPDKKIKLKAIPLEPIETFIKDDEQNFILGPDPRYPNSEKAFSAAKVYEEEKFAGYIYVILGGEEYTNATQLVFGSYILRLGIRSMIITLVAAITIGLLVLQFIMRNVKKLVKVTHDFQSGNLTSRLKIANKDELGTFAESFNEMADTIVDNIEEIKSKDNLRRDLIANVSHDLRTPLASIQGYIETLMIKNDILTQDEQDKYMNIILNSTESLKKLVEELFELSKLEAKETKPLREMFSIAELANDIQQKNLVVAQEKNIRLQFHAEKNLPLVFADISMIEKVIQNLIDNAIKFTAENGNILVKLNSQNEFVVVDIADNGSGISSSELPNIFDRYHKKQRVQSEENVGLGLGLAIVKKILEVHDLFITVDSTFGEGTTFSLKLPAHKNTEANNT